MYDTAHDRVCDCETPCEEHAKLYQISEPEQCQNTPEK
ncbi:(Na+)-NQR maturation NqrM [Celerinatantimonas diazotrophica]